MSRRFGLLPLLGRAAAYGAREPCRRRAAVVAAAALADSTSASPRSPSARPAPNTVTIALETLAADDVVERLDDGRWDIAARAVPP
jgi:hypothetical protein